MNQENRLISLDVFRGLTIAGMILVNNPGTWSAVYPPLRHAPWHGCTLTDLIFPFFLFIVGVAITLSLGKRKQRGDAQKELILKIVRRSIILFALGLILAIPSDLDFAHWRIPGVLQRIALVYLVASLVFLKCTPKTQLAIAAGLLVGYWLLMTVVPVPGVGPANLEPDTNLGAWLDRLILGGHLWRKSQVWDPEGLLSTLPAVSTALIGVLAGAWLTSKRSPEIKMLWLFVAANGLLALAYVWNGFFPINKNLWTSSYVVFTGGLALHFLALCAWLIDVQGDRWNAEKWVKPFIVFGSNAITVYFLSGVLARLLILIKFNPNGAEPITLKGFLFQHLLQSWLPDHLASLTWALLYVSLWLGLMWILYAKKIFIKV